MLNALCMVAVVAFCVAAWIVMWRFHTLDEGVTIPYSSADKYDSPDRVQMTPETHIRAHDTARRIDADFDARDGMFEREPRPVRGGKGESK